MAKLNCWEFNKCGREPKGEKAHELGICPAAVFDESDGFCDGKNGGRACMYISGTLCNENISGTRIEARKNCGSCDFYGMIKLEHGSEASVFSFERYINLRKINFMGMSDHEIYKVSPIIRKEDVTKPNGVFQESNQPDIWLRLLKLVDYCNHAVKQGEWYQEDIEQYYNLKDLMMEKFYRDPPPGAIITLKKSIKPLKNGESDLSSQMEQPCENNNVQGKVLIEMEVTYEKQEFCFHIPLQKAKDWGLDMVELSSKDWIPSREFNRQFFKSVHEEIRQILSVV